MITKPKHRPGKLVSYEYMYWNRGSKIKSEAVCEIVRRSVLFEQVYTPTLNTLDRLSKKYIFLNTAFDLAYGYENLAVLGAVYLMSQQLNVPKSQTKLSNHIQKTEEFLKNHSIDLKSMVINQ